MERTGLPGDTGTAAVKSGSTSRSTRCSVCFDEGPDQLVPETQIEREHSRAGASRPATKRLVAAAQRDGAGPYLQRGLLREPEQEVREVVSADAGAGCSARRVEPREDGARTSAFGSVSLLERSERTSPPARARCCL